MQDENNTNPTPADLEENIGDDIVIDHANDDLDVVYDEDENSVPTDTIKKLREKLKVAIEEKQKYLDGWQRDKAEFVNARKRDEEDKKNLLKFAEANLISEIIPALDAFDMAMANKEAWEKADKNCRVGVEYIYSQISNALQNHGLTKIDPKGEIFDPNHQHSVAVVH
ncbi:MAG: nucleotide exchange factor GrpE, partial [Candidatus Paceibacterota bacterium]